jgi:hypothetical protein
MGMIYCEDRIKRKTKNTTIPKSNIIIIEGDKIDTPNTPIHDYSLA